jgi:uncharacterized protein
MKLNLIILKDTYSIYSFKNDTDIPEWIKDSDFYSVTKTKDELSIVCRKAELTTSETAIDKDWRIIKIRGPLDLSLVGIIAEISTLLKNSNIPVFTLSTFNTDYILVKVRDLSKAVDSLKYISDTVIFEN